MKENQEEPEPPQIKEEQKSVVKDEQEEVFISLEKEQLEQRWPTDSFTGVTIHEKTEKRKPESNEDQLTIQTSAEPEKQNQGRSNNEESGSNRIQPLCMHEELGKPEPQQMKENQEEPEPPQIKEEQKSVVKDEQEEVFISLEKEQLEQRWPTDSFTGVTIHEKTEKRKPESNEDQLTIQTSAEPEKQNQGRSNNEESGSNRADELEEKSFQHFRVETGNVVGPEAEWQETICGRNFSGAACFSRHMRTHTGETPYSCFCGKRFPQRSNFTKHIKTHMGEKPFSCLTCGKNFSSKDSLSRHNRTHTGERPFSCLTCGKTFSSKDGLSQHIRTHTGERPFSCLTCGKSFADRGCLSRHKKIHSGERPFSCTTCGRRFIQRSHLTSHMMTHRVGESSRYN
uniref:C2H2-type domain-containing protein n=1 Tax=Poecilia mexicana TaxID=48701 RepID=A0A3B3WSX4_9TELE